MNIHELVISARKSPEFAETYAGLCIQERLIVQEMLQKNKLTADEAEAWYQRIASKTHLEQTVDALFGEQDPESLPALTLLRLQNRTNPIV